MLSPSAQSQFVALATLADGVCVIEETIFEARFKVVPELIKMGARIYLDENKAVVEGVMTLAGANLCGKDLRGTAALVIAALAAEGESTITGTGNFPRPKQVHAQPEKQAYPVSRLCYQNFLYLLLGIPASPRHRKGLKGLGADIKRVVK